jgi:glycosyltransferase involved in cell wall biosynthesis
MQVVFNTWAGAFFQKGGGEVQLLKSQAALEHLGVRISLFDQWNPNIPLDVLHQFAIQTGVEHVVKRYKDRGVATAVSPIMWFCPAPSSDDFHRVKSVLEMSDVVFTNSNKETNQLSSHFGISQSKFIKTRNSISEAYQEKGDMDLFRRTFGIEGEFVLSVGNIDERKGTHQLVEACKRIGKKLIVIGHIKEKHYFSTFKDSNPNCTFLGPIEDETLLKSAYRSCRVFALPSYCETPGIAALEAAAQGAAVVLTNEGCGEEYLENYAYYVSPWSLDSIIEGVNAAYEGGPKEGCDSFVLKNYRWDITAKEILSGYRRILNRDSN